jgi:hypothetical protein
MKSTRLVPGLLLTVLTAGGLAAGCSRSTLSDAERPEEGLVADLGTGFFDERVEAFVIPPQGWQLDPPKINDERTHLTWLSPTGDTAYGVVYFQLPLIAALVPSRRMVHERAVDGYIDAFRADAGDAELLEEAWDAQREAMRLVAEGGPYTVRSILTLRGRSGWSVYAGTLRDEPVNDPELAVAIRAREATRISREAEGGATAAEAILERLESD